MPSHSVHYYYCSLDKGVAYTRGGGGRLNRDDPHNDPQDQGSELCSSTIIPQAAVVADLTHREDALTLIPRPLGGAHKIGGGGFRFKSWCNARGRSSHSAMKTGAAAPDAAFATWNQVTSCPRVQSPVPA